MQPPEEDAPVPTSFYILCQSEEDMHELSVGRVPALIQDMARTMIARVLRVEKELCDSLANRVGYWREVWWREHD